MRIPGNLPEMVIYFGSQTGNAERFANNLDEDAQHLGVEKSTVIDFNSFNPDDFVKHKLVIVCVSTHYEGDPCDNTKQFYKWFRGLLRDKANPKPFKGMSYAIFGLGDTSYEQFNEMGIQFDKGFEQLGATRIFELGAANAEHHTTEDDFDNWRARFWPALIDFFEKTQTEADV